MAVYGWDGVTADVAMPASGQTVNSTPFSVPSGTSVLRVHMPALVGTGATAKVQALSPGSDRDSEVWTDVIWIDPDNGTFDTLDGLGESSCIAIPIRLVGGGVLRFVASEDQSSAASTIKVVFHRGG